MSVNPAVVERMTAQDAQILAEYGAGTTMRTIAKRLAVSLDEVTEAVRDTADSDRSVANRLSLAWQQTPAAKKWRAEQDAGAAKAAEQTVVAALDKSAPAPKAAPERVAPSTTRYPAPGPIVAVVDRCVASKHIPTTGAECSVCGAPGMQHEDDRPAATEPKPEHVDPEAPPFAPPGGPVPEPADETTSVAFRRLEVDRDNLAKAFDEANNAWVASERKLAEAIAKAEVAEKARAEQYELHMAESTLREQCGAELAELKDELAGLYARELQAKGDAVAVGADALAIADAEATGSPILVGAAGDVRKALDDLRERVEQWRVKAPLREEAAQLEARLAEIRAELGVAL